MAIAFDAKWIAGSPQLHTELYYNRVALTTLLAQPDRPGTPGQPNSTLSTNLGPTYSNLRHDPPVPMPGESITISVVAHDPDGVAQLDVHYSVNEGPWQQMAMSVASQPLPSDRVRRIRYSAALPPQASSGTVIQFFVNGLDSRGACSFCPPAGADSRALIRVDNRTTGLKRRPFHLILTGRDGRVLDDSQNMMSDDRLGATVIWDDREVFYDCGVHLHGSMFSRNNPDAATLNIRFPGDHWYRGVHRTVQAKRRVIQEIIAKHVQNQSGVPGMYEDIVHLFAHRAAHAGPARLSLAHYSDVFLDSQFEDGAAGTLFNMEGIRVAMATHDGTSEGVKLPFPIDWVSNYDITDLGGDPEQYRWSTMIRNNRARDDYSRYLALAHTFSLSGAALQQSVPSVMDVDEWMRVFALLSLFGIGDAYTQGNPHNLNLYVRPSDQRILAFPYDWDFFFALDSTAPLWGDQNLSKIIALPVWTRLFHGHLLDLIETTFNPNYLAPWIDHFGSVAGEDYRNVLDRVRARSDFVRSRLPDRIAFAITSNNGADFAVTTATTTLEGRGWIDVDRLYLSSQPNPLPLTWLDGTRWRVSAPLRASTNHLTLEARNAPGARVLVARDPGALQVRYGSLQPISGQYGGSLDNGGETLRLIDQFGTVIQEFAYDDSEGWPWAADGGGCSLEWIDPGGDPNSPASWQASPTPGGSPGQPELVPPELTNPRIDGDAIVVSFTARPGQSYHLEGREELGAEPWRSVATVPAPSVPHQVEIRDARFVQAGTRFYRLVSP